MNNSNKLLSNIASFRTYAKFLQNMGRRESFDETINRNMVMNLDKFPNLSRDIIKAYQLVHEFKIMPSMRAFQFSGEAILKNNCRQYNCSFLAIDDIRAFGEILFLLLSGVGVGYSVQKIHINNLPKVGRTTEEGIFKVHDSIQGWSQALDMLIDAYFCNRIRPVFDFSDVRPKGSYLVTTGAKAPGPEPLKYMLGEVEARLKLARGRKLTSLEIHDIICIISDCVLAGGIRRAACISLFDKDDQEMLKCKSGEWWTKHPYRARANNSAVLLRQEIKKEEFDFIFNICKDSGSGEPGFSWTNDLSISYNPCHEIALNSNQFCNLTTISQTGIDSKKEFLKRVYSATLIGTLQAAYTDFPYIRQNWKNITEKEALIGVSFTGIADSSNTVSAKWLIEGAKLVKEVNEKYAKKIGINLAARTTTVKPEGTSSCVLGSSSGIHARHSEYYIRRVRMNKNDALAAYLQKTIPELVEEDFNSATGVVVSIPQESPKGSILRENETALDLFNRAIKYNKYWIKPGHRSGKNRHNVSCTISVKPEEWETLKEAMWENREYYSGISLLPYDGGTYKQAPFETITKEIFEKLNSLVKDVDLTKVTEAEDNTSRINQLACIGKDTCEIL
jgi:ribonucleoside-diphosphate reductase alpha chain